MTTGGSGADARAEEGAGDQGGAGGAFAWLPPILPSADLSAQAAAGLVAATVPYPRGVEGWDLLDRMARVLHRRRGGHILLTGLPGVGKTAAIGELARRAGAGQIPFLRGRRFLWADTQRVPPEQAAGCLAALLAQVAEASDVVLAIDGLGSLLRGMGAKAGLALLTGLDPERGPRLIGIMDRWEAMDLVAAEPALLEVFSRVDLEEPTEEVAEVIASRAAEGLAEEYGLEIGRAVARQAVRLSSSFLLGERLPSKAIRVLRRACDDLAYELAEWGRARREVREEDLVRVVAELTGLAPATLAGEGDGRDLEAALGREVVGQADAVRAVADELTLIKAGLSDGDKPAAVLLFAGMTGVGKTELAKALAELSSTSRRLQTYSMGNYLESHTVSGIIGVPPGYVGHEAGGRLINELNADPHAVFLLDEAEKCHPNVWKPFLNLFDEGWIVDAKGVKAHADRAIFILTTNAGDDAIAQMTRTGASVEAIEAHVKDTLARVRQERSGQPVFPPQFLARIKRIVIFRPLDEAAMVGIARKVVARVEATWLRRRDKHLVVTPGLIERIGQLSHRLNEEAGGREGGRIVRKLVAELVETPVQRHAIARMAEYRAARTVLVSLDDASPAADAPPDVEGATAAQPARPAVRVGFEPDPGPGDAP